MHATEPDEPDDYDEFLATFDAWSNPALVHACMPQYIDDDLSKQRMIATASEGETTLEREPFQEGQKSVSANEAHLKCLDFFKQRQTRCCGELRDRLVHDGIATHKIDEYFDAIANVWTQGRSTRLKSPQMQAIFASIARHDHAYRPDAAGKFVVNSKVSGVTPLFTPEEMASLFLANQNMLETGIADYFKAIGNGNERSINRTYARRGMYCDRPPVPRWKEQDYLSSYTLMLTVAELFSQTWRPSTQATGKPTIVSTILPNLQQRVVAFAGFIDGMEIRQVELVVAPPVRAFNVRYHGTHGTNAAIEEFEYE